MQMTCRIDGRKIVTLDNFYDQLAAQLPLPSHFGRNLDALWDTLTAELEGPLTIVWLHADESRNRLGDTYIKVKILLEEAAGERDDLTVSFEGD